MKAAAENIWNKLNFLRPACRKTVPISEYINRGIFNEESLR